MAKKKATRKTTRKTARKTARKQPPKAKKTAAKPKAEPRTIAKPVASPKPNKFFVYTFILLSLVGIYLSVYLTYQHYAPAVKGSGCDFSDTISCSLVNNSVYSELFHVPIAIFGLIWFILFIWMSSLSFSQPKKYALPLFTWTVLGMLSVVYLVFIEFILQAICPYCTGIHIILLLFFILAWINLRQQKVPCSVKNMLQETQGWIVGAGLLVILTILIFNFAVADKQDYDGLAQCMTENDIVMYGSFRCGFCAKTRANFGDSFQHINEIECHPQGEHAQVELCLQKNIDITPTWVQEVDGQELKRHDGYMTMEELKEFSGCDV